ncbi:MAG: efflux RND transporter periplasmic adaptor subunit [Pseudomonadales bacterium]
MNPTVTSPVPAKDAMGMDYVPVYADDAAGDATIRGTVSIDPVVTQNIGVRTAVAERSTMSRVVRTVGRIDYAEPRIARIHPKVAGWIDTMFVDTTGEAVKTDTILLSIYSPRLVSSQEEYLLALKNFEQLENSPFDDVREGARELLESSRARLELLDVPAHQIAELESSRQLKKTLHIHSPRPGIVMSVGARPGQHVTPGTELYMIADLSVVWAYADVFEHELPWIAVGDRVEITVSGLPGNVFQGSLEYVYPYAQADTRTVKVRLAFDNPDLLLKPEMFAEVVIHAGRQEDAIVVPAEAIVRSGASTQVFVVRAPGKFEPRVVETGLESDGRVSVIDGLKAGEEVVTSALFLIDSESKLREAAAKMVEAAAGSDGDHGADTHSGHAGHDR